MDYGRVSEAVAVFEVSSASQDDAQGVEGFLVALDVRRPETGGYGHPQMDVCAIPLVGGQVPKVVENRLGNFLGNCDFPNWLFALESAAWDGSSIPSGKPDALADLLFRTQSIDCIEGNPDQDLHACDGAAQR